MKNQFKIVINEPCQENISNMTPNAKGFYCSLCAKNVFDLSNKTEAEVAQFIEETKGQNICASLSKKQLNTTFEATVQKNNILKYAAVIATTAIMATSAQVEKPNQITGDIILVQNKKVSFKLSGKIIDAKTKKVVKGKEMTLFLNGTKANLIPKKGLYEIDLTIEEGTRLIEVVFMVDDSEYRFNLGIDEKTIKDNKQEKNIFIEQKYKVYVHNKSTGGMGIIYSNENDIEL